MKFVAIDWGTSSFRAWLIERDQVSDIINTDQGVKNFAAGAHSEYLTDVLGKWQGQFQFIIAIGMIGSNIGLHETNFSPLPIDIDEVSNSLIQVPNFEPALFIVPGVSKVGDVMRGIPTPRAGDGLKRGSIDPMEPRNGLPGFVQMDAPGGQLNPPWVEWLMGWPIGWTDCEPLGMDKFQQWRQKHSVFSRIG